MIYFWKITDKYGVFSQWYPSEFIDFEGVKYSSAEQYMMYQKALLFQDKETAQEILKENNPKNIKALGRKIKNFDEKVWNDKKLCIVIMGNYHKFSNNIKMGELLLSTGDELIAEASPVDKIWGIGIDEQNAINGADWRGENLLGKSLMIVRNIIRYKDMK